MSKDMDTQIGFVDQSLGRYSDALSFHLPADMCKKLSGGRFSFSFGYNKAGRKAGGAKQTFRLTHICLTEREPVFVR